jgi:hypothetical protein
MIIPLQKSHGTPACSTSTPAAGRPMPPPTPNTALSRPIAPATRSQIPPATPCTVRPAMTQPIDGASAHITEPAQSSASTTGSTRSLP